MPGTGQALTVPGGGDCDQGGSTLVYIQMTQVSHAMLGDDAVGIDAGKAYRASGQHRHDAALPLRSAGRERNDAAPGSALASAGNEIGQAADVAHLPARQELAVDLAQQVHRQRAVDGLQAVDAGQGGGGMGMADLAELDLPAGAVQRLAAQRWMPETRGRAL